MIEYIFGPDDVAKTRFAISPLWETAAAIRALRDPSVGSLHLPWVKRIRPHLKELDLSLPLALLPKKGYIADFLTPPPETPPSTIVVIGPSDRPAALTSASALRRASSIAFPRACR